MNKINQKKWMKYGLIFAMLAAMTGLSEILQEPELIFPEIAALVIGAWFMPRQPWKTTRRKMFCLMTISAIAGICIVRYLPFSLFIKVGIAFFFTAISLTITKTTMVPMISACILPILLGTESILYPISVSIMTAIIAIIQYLLEKLKIHTPIRDTEKEINIKKEAFHWGILGIVLLMAAALPIHFQMLYLIAPPLIVSFVEFSESESVLRKSSIKIWLTFIITAAIGAGSRLLLHEYFKLPLTICIFPAMGILFLLFERNKFSFPPIGAVGLLPLILNPKTLWSYPIQIAIGSFIFIILPQILFPSEQSSKIFNLSKLGKEKMLN